MAAETAACANCGHPIAEGARFCPNCGSPVAARPAEPAQGPTPVISAEARKIVTVVFADLVGSTDLTERLDPEEARDVVGKFYGVVRDAVERFGGIVANLIGDAVLAVFGLPAAHEDDPERAVRAGLGIRDAMPVLNDHTQAAHGVRLAVRVGINTGEVVAASGSTFDRDFLISDAVTAAARLQQSLRPGMVAVGERTHRLTEHALEYHPLPPLTVKGKSTPLAAWEAVAPRSERLETRRYRTPLIGRHGELGLLRHLYGRGRDEALAQLVTVLGHPGVGKSRLLHEFITEVCAAEPQPLVLRGRSLAFGGQIGFNALVDILRGQAQIHDMDRPDVVLAKIGAWLGRVLPDPADASREPRAEPGYPAGASMRSPGQALPADALLPVYGDGNGEESDPGRRRQRLFDAWHGLLASLAATRPVVLALEDIHWADDGMLDLIEWVSERVHDVPLFVLCLSRPEMLDRRPGWGGGRRNATTINLAPLRPHETEYLISALSHQDLDESVRHSIAQRSGGNPFFIEELMRMVAEGAGPDVAIPETVQAVLTARIDRLPPRERRALQAAAVIGRGFWPPPVASLAGLTRDETMEAVEGLIGKDLVVRRPRSTLAGEPEYAFRHVLIRDVAYGLLLRAQRQRAHAEAARWLQSRMGERLEDVVEILAEHLRLAGDDAQAAGYLHRAGNKARRLYANAEATRLFGQALEAARRANLPARLMTEIHRDRGEVHQLLGDYRAALDDFHEGLRLARQSQDRALMAVLENRVGLIHHRLMELEPARSHFTRAVDLAREAGEGHALGQSLIDLANIRWDLDELSPDDPALAEGLALLRRADDPSGLARGLNLLCMAHLGAGNGEESLDAARQALDVARSAGDKSREATSLSYLCVGQIYLGRTREALRCGEAATALAREIGDRRRLAFAMDFEARARFALGDWGTAISLLEQGYVLAKDVAWIHLPYPISYLCQIYYEIGDLAKAREAARIGAPMVTPHPTWRAIILLCAAYLARLDGDTAALNRVLDECLASPSGFVPNDGEMLLPVGEALLEVERDGDLRAFIAARVPRLARMGCIPHLASAAYLEALMAERGGRTDEALARADEAVRLGEAAEHSQIILRARDLRLRLRNREEDRHALRALVSRIADSLPDDLRSTFLTTPRAAVLRE